MAFSIWLICRSEYSYPPESNSSTFTARLGYFSSANVVPPPFSPTSRSRASPSTKADQNRDEDDDADNDLLDEARDTENVEPIRQHADQNEAESRTDHGSPAAK